MRSLVVFFTLAKLAAAQLGLSDNEVQPLNMPQITRLDVDCAKTGMTVNIEFSAPFNGVIFSKGFYANPSCRYVTTNSGQYDYVFTIPLSSCGTDAFSRAAPGGGGGGGGSFNDLERSSGGGGGQVFSSPSGRAEMFRNTIVIQQDERLQELWDVSRTINCEWQDNLVKTVTSNALNVQMMDSVSLRFAGDDAVDCWMDLQIGRWPQSVSANSVVRIGEDLSILIYANDPRGKFDMHIKDCYASSSPNFNEPGAISIQLTDYDGCIVKEKLIGPFVYTKTAGSHDDGDYTLLAIAFLQAFKFPDVMDVYLTCNVEICKDKCDNPCQYFYEGKQIENTTPSYPPYNPTLNGRQPVLSHSGPSSQSPSISSSGAYENPSSFGFLRSEARSTPDYASTLSPVVGPGGFSSASPSFQPPQAAAPNNNNLGNGGFGNNYQGLVFAPGKSPGRRPPQLQQQHLQQPGPAGHGVKNNNNPFQPVPVNVHPSVFQQGGGPSSVRPPVLHGNNNNNGPPPLVANGNNGPPGSVPSRNILPPPFRQGRAPNQLLNGGAPFTFASPPNTSPSPVYLGPGKLPQVPPQHQRGNNLQQYQADSSADNLVLNQQIFFPQHRADNQNPIRDNLAVFLQARKLKQNHENEDSESDQEDEEPEGKHKPAKKQRDFVQAAAGFKPNNNPYGDKSAPKNKQGNNHKNAADPAPSRVRRTVDVPRNALGEPGRQGKVRVTRSINVVGPSDIRSLAAYGNESGLLYLQESDLIPPDTCISTTVFSTTLCLTLAALLGALGYAWALHSKSRHGQIFLDLGGVSAHSKS